MKEKAVFGVERTLLFSTRALGHYQQKPRSEKLNHTFALQQAINFWQKGTSFSDVAKNVDYDTPGDVNSINAG